ncbi:uncharacterized protein [Anabrus simplex]|uniref:uncharacterized protein n=1 Tax=Anabrus simplex TaxID=316456 RepID=UPI0035A3A451
MSDPSEVLHVGYLRKEELINELSIRNVQSGGTVAAGTTNRKESPELPISTPTLGGIDVDEALSMITDNNTELASVVSFLEVSDPSPNQLKRVQAILFHFYRRDSDLSLKLNEVQGKEASNIVEDLSNMSSKVSQLLTWSATPKTHQAAVVYMVREEDPSRNVESGKSVATQQTAAPLGNESERRTCVSPFFLNNAVSEASSPPRPLPTMSPVFSRLPHPLAMFLRGPHTASKYRVDFIEELQASGRNLAQVDPESASLMSANTEGPASGPVSGPAASSSVSVISQRNTQPETVSNRVVPEDVVAEQSTKKPKVTTTSTPQSLLENSVASFPSTSENNHEVRSIEEVIKCNDKTLEPLTAQRSEFWVHYNYVPPKRKYRCYETITYTTHADYTFLDNLKSLLERWQGPVSLTMHAPGTDFKPTLAAIRYARDCLSPLVEEFVTFHVFFGTRHVPREVPYCSLPGPWFNVSASSLYKAKNRILYPVNMGRNIARESAITYYIELYPSPGVIPAFLEMVRRQDPPLLRPGPKVFPLSIFELEKGMPLPENKTQLVNMLKNGTANPIHKKLCPGCHNVSKSKEWMAANVTEGLHIFHIGKRMGYHIHWEPIFIGTHHDPLYDERLSWEGKSDKMTQGYVLRVLDYEFQILGNAFLVHKPGIKTLKKDPQRAMLAGKINALIKKVILPELKVLNGIKKGCAV